MSDNARKIGAGEAVEHPFALLARLHHPAFFQLFERMGYSGNGNIQQRGNVSHRKLLMMAQEPTDFYAGGISQEAETRSARFKRLPVFQLFLDFFPT